MKKVLLFPLLISSILLFSCGKNDTILNGNNGNKENVTPPGGNGAGNKRSPIVSVTKSYTFACNDALKSLADVYVVYVDADGKPSKAEKVTGKSWERTGIKIPLGKATAVEGSTAGVSVICDPNTVPENSEYDVTYELNCTYTITREDGSTANLSAWNINPQMPAVEGRDVGEACNAISLSCTNDGVIVCDDQGNAYIADSDFWEEEEGEYIPEGELGGADQEPPTRWTAVDYADVPEAVDLGFTVDGKPLLWATRNVGACSPGDFGGLYGWGDASGYHTETNPVFYPARHPENIVGNNGNSISGTRCDIAYCTWGTQWRMPSKAEWEALAANCNWVKKKMDGNWGMEFTSKKNGKSIFLPGADARYGENLYRESTSPDNCHGYYWCGDWVATDAQMAYHFYYTLSWDGTVYSKAQIKDRYFGMSVRPVTSVQPTQVR